MEWNSDLTLEGGFDIWTVVMSHLSTADIMNANLNTVSKASYTTFVTLLHKKNKFSAMKLIIPELTKNNSIKVPRWVRHGDFITNSERRHKSIFDGNKAVDYMEGYRLDITTYSSVRYFMFATDNRRFVFQFNEFIHEREIKFKFETMDIMIFQKFTRKNDKASLQSIFIKESLDVINNNMVIIDGVSYFCGSFQDDLYYLTFKEFVSAGITKHNLCNMD